jgi:AraC family transcriptional regulator of adaptative response/methylated-DNA-[protein]-cysteine methyltransferase
MPEHPSGRAGGGVGLRYAVAECWLGRVLVAARGRTLCWVALGDQAEGLRNELGQAWPGALETGPVGELATVLEAVLAKIEDPGRACSLDLERVGTPFQRAVWAALGTIPAGETRTYSRIAEQIGRPRAMRAVGAACAANRLAVVVPCHRVVRRAGELGGYRWGLERKQALLAREGRTPGP